MWHSQVAWAAGAPSPAASPRPWPYNPAGPHRACNLQCLHAHPPTCRRLLEVAPLPMPVLRLDPANAATGSEWPDTSGKNNNMALTSTTYSSAFGGIRLMAPRTRCARQWTPPPFPACPGWVRPPLAEVVCAHSDAPARAWLARCRGGTATECVEPSIWHCHRTAAPPPAAGSVWFRNEESGGVSVNHYIMSINRPSNNDQNQLK